MCRVMSDDCQTIFYKNWYYSIIFRFGFIQLTLSLLIKI
nr:MAG TPA: hypothetical protein [Caudoviricetes sp.]